eukprot:6762743-Pyramimonas_sp.AAC.1
MVVADLMHCSCLGIAQYVLGNIMWELFTHMGGTFDRHVVVCGRLCGLVKMAAKQHHIQAPFGHLSIGMIRASRSAPPKLKLKASRVDQL